jgi:hypothetical protein
MSLTTFTTDWRHCPWQLWCNQPAIRPIALWIQPVRPYKFAQQSVQKLVRTRLIAYITARTIGVGVYLRGTAQAVPLFSRDGSHKLKPSHFWQKRHLEPSHFRNRSDAYGQLRIYKSNSSLHVRENVSRTSSLLVMCLTTGRAGEGADRHAWPPSLPSPSQPWSPATCIREPSVTIWPRTV